jgi:hypothetical protein
MELIDVIKSSLIIFFSFLSVTAVFSYISFRIKDKTREKPVRNIRAQTETLPVSGIYPRMFAVGDLYKIPGKISEKSSSGRFNIFKYYSFNLSEKMHKLRLSVNR